MKTSMLDRGFIDSARQMKAIDEWHYQVRGEIRLWNKKDYTDAEWEDVVEEFTREGISVFSLKG